MNKKEQKQVFADRLNQALRERNMTARTLAKITGIDETYISKYRKAYAMPSRGRIIDLCMALGVNALWLLGYSDNPEQTISKEDQLRNDIDRVINGMPLSQLEYAKEAVIVISEMDDGQCKKFLNFAKEYIL